jgi:SAM-dependent methyltransferase
MKRIVPEPDWPASWLKSFAYDLMEVYGEPASDLGYASSYRVRNRLAIDLIRSVAAPGARVLDVAAAQGNFSIALAERGYDVTWNDIRAELAEYVDLKRERGLIAYSPGNILDLEPTGDYDVVLATEVVEHVAHPDRFLTHLGLFLRPGGYLIVTTPNGAFVRNKLPRFSDHSDPAIFEGVQFQPNADGHIWLLYPDEIAPLAVRAGLLPRDLRLFTNPLTAGWMKTTPLLRALPAGVVDALERLSRRAPRPLRERLMTHMVIVLRRATSSDARQADAR